MGPATGWRCTPKAACGNGARAWKHGWPRAPTVAACRSHSAPAWGPQRNGALAGERVFENERYAEPQRLSLTARAGYGFAAAGGVLTPFADLALSGESDSQHYRTGIGFARNGIEAALTAGHRAGGEPDTRIGMDLRLNF